jgi:hypothetical protein
MGKWKSRKAEKLIFSAKIIQEKKTFNMGETEIDEVGTS